ncbi:MAG: hypothetical protein WBQ32_01265, partial [Ignavibacteriaceae bacterium]
SNRISGSEFNFNIVEAGNWVLYNKEHINELEMQKYEFPDFSILNTKEFKKVTSFNDFVLYEKLP